MLRACLITLLVAAAFHGVGPAAMAADPTAPAASPTTPATGQTESLKGTLVVTLGSSAKSPGKEAISAMLTNGALSHNAAAMMLKQQQKAKVDIQDFGISAVSKYTEDSGQITIEVVFQVPRWDPPLARQFLVYVAQALYMKLLGYPGNYQDRLRLTEALAQEHLNQSRGELAELRAKQREFYQEAGRTDLSRESIMASAKAMETQEQKLQMDQVGRAARQKALAQRIEQIAAKAEARAAEDPVAAELKKVVDLREQELGRAKQLNKVGQMSETEVGAIEIKVAEARAEWLKRREAAGSLAGRDLLAKLNEELLTLEVDNAETAARYEHIEKQLAKNRKILPIADEYQDNIADALRLAEREVQNTLQQRSDAERQARDFVPPTVVVVPSE